MKISRAFHHAEEDTNVWPAVTDTILLIASIFIVFSVLLLSLISLKKEDELNGGAGGGELIASTYRIPEGILFESGKTLLQPGAAQALRTVINDSARQIPQIREYVKNQGWTDYYIVLEASGHADYEPTISSIFSGGDGNWDLSTSRANTVIHTIEEVLAHDGALKTRLGVSYTYHYGEALAGQTILRASGYSSHMPCVSYRALGSPSPQLIQVAKDRNRRVEIRLYAEPAGILKVQEEWRSR